MSNYKTEEVKLILPLSTFMTSTLDKSHTYKSYSYWVNLTEIIRQKHIIPMQYETINIGGNPDDMHKLSKKVDRYLLHIVEEIAEFLEETDKVFSSVNLYSVLNEKYHKDCLMELIDVIGYIASLASIFYIDLYGVESLKDTSSKDIVYTVDSNSYNPFKTERKETVVNKVLLEVEQMLMLNVRRKFPERKWHKDVNRTLSIKELNDLYESCFEETSQALCKAISLFMYLTDHNYDLFTKMFLEKNKEVYSLKK